MTRIMVVNALVFTFQLAACAAGQELAVRSKNVWQVVENLANESPLSKAAVEEAVGAPLHLHLKDEYKSHWVGSNISLSDGVKITTTSLVLDPDNRFDSTSGTTLYLSGRCVRLAEIRQHHSDIYMIDSPRSPSSNEETVYESAKDTNRIIFSFKESDFISFS